MLFFTGLPQINLSARLAPDLTPGMLKEMCEVHKSEGKKVRKKEKPALLYSALPVGFEHGHLYSMDCTCWDGVLCSYVLCMSPPGTARSRDVCIVDHCSAAALGCTRHLSLVQSFCMVGTGGGN